MTNKTHTADTLKFYLGQEVYWAKKKKVFFLASIRDIFTFTGPDLRALNTIKEHIIYNKHVDLTTHNKGDYDRSEGIRHALYEIDNQVKDVYPILKTADDLDADAFFPIDTSEMIYGYGDRKNFKLNKNFTYSIKDRVSQLRPVEICALLKEGFGAKAHSGSPTGYSDLFGMPCVTPKMVEEGVDAVKSNLHEIIERPGRKDMFMTIHIPKKDWDNYDTVHRCWLRLFHFLHILHLDVYKGVEL